MTTATMNAQPLVGRLDPCFAWDGERLLDPTSWVPGAPPPGRIHGAVASANIGSDGRLRLLRDPLGLNKLFWCMGPDGRLTIGSRPIRLVEAGCPFEAIRAFPPGAVADVDPADGTVEVRWLKSALPRMMGPRDSYPLDDLAAEISERLNRYMAAVASAHGDARVYVCASGGLDSTGAAVLARRHFRDVVAVNFDIRRCGRSGSEDRRTAQRLARDLGISFLGVTVTPRDLVRTLDTVMLEAVDWRDFNVHAALVNSALARVIAGAAGRDRRALVLTGDVMNELLADYEPETYHGRTYYRLPNVSRADLRHILVRGLETSNRERGPFGVWGLPVVQPYAAVADRYLMLPDAFFKNPRRKIDLARLIFGGAIPDYIYDRPKIRAQIGDETTGRGVLGICIDRGLDNAWLRDRFAQLHGLTSRKSKRALDRFIRCGRYRAGIPFDTENGE